MPVAATVHWNARPASGNANNGGGFDSAASGTDFSNQDSPQYALTGIASSGSGNTVLSAAAAADMVGNVGQVISGTNFNTGFFTVVSVSVGVSITFGTNISSQSICSGVGASGIINIGGAIVSVAAAYAEAQIGNTIYLQGTYTVAATLALTLSSGSTPFTFEGYTTTPGDGTDAPVATWTTSTNSTSLVTFAGLLGYRFKFLTLSSTAGTPGNLIDAGTAGGNSRVGFDSCRITGGNYGFFGPFVGSYYWEGLALNNCEIDHCVVDGVKNVGGTMFFGCSVHDNGGIGGNCQSTQGNHFTNVSMFSAFWLNGAEGLLSNDGTIVSVGSVYSDNVTAGLSMGANSSGAIEDNIFYANGTYGFVSGGGFVPLPRANAFGANTTAPVNGTGYAAAGPKGDVTLSADPFTSRSTGDFSLNSTAGGGAALKAAGFQSTRLG